MLPDDLTASVHAAGDLPPVSPGIDQLIANETDDAAGTDGTAADAPAGSGDTPEPATRRGRGRPRGSKTKRRRGAKRAPVNVPAEHEHEQADDGGDVHELPPGTGPDGSTPEQRDEVANRHAGYFVNLAEQFGPVLNPAADWRATDGEAVMLASALRRFYDNNGIIADLPPGIALVAAVGMFVVPRALAGHVAAFTPAAVAAEPPAAAHGATDGGE